MQRKHLMTKTHSLYNPHKLVVIAIIFLVAGCDTGFVDSAQSLGTNDRRFIVLGDVDGDLDMVVANQNQVTGFILTTVWLASAMTISFLVQIVVSLSPSAT